MTIPFVISVAVLIGLCLFLYREIRRPHGPKKWGHTPKWPKRIRVTLVSIPLIIGLLVFWGFFIEPNRLIVKNETIQINNWPTPLNDLKIAVLADIHAGGAFIDQDKLRLIVKRTNELNPDIIVVLGDFISRGRGGTEMEPEVFAPILKNFKAPFGVYAVLGNHDWWYDGNKVRRALEANGIRVLENEVLLVNVRGTSFWFAGLSDLWTRPQRIAETIDRIPADQPIIALTHNPDIFPQLPHRVPLLLAAHTHGGQVSFPFIGPVIEPSNYGQRYVQGHVVEDGHHLFVTTGIGTSIIPVRCCVTPEIVLLTVKRE
jgi:uncharacterized protein